MLVAERLAREAAAAGTAPPPPRLLAQPQPAMLQQPSVAAASGKDVKQPASVPITRDVFFRSRGYRKLQTGVLVWFFTGETKSHTMPMWPGIVRASPLPSVSLQR